jgi:hypothetical protein
MNDLANITASENKLSLIRKFIYEIVLVILMFSVAYLFIKIGSLDQEIKTYLREDRVTGIQKIDLNTEAILQNTLILKDVRSIMEARFEKQREYESTH